VTQLPGTGAERRETNRCEGSGTPTTPPSPISKQPISSAGPNRFLVARTIRSVECRSPSKEMTTSTRCSSARGPAMAPSLVTWPTRIVVMFRLLATALSALATARTCVAPPSVPSTAGERTVCTLSSTSSEGFTSSTWDRTADSSVSAAR
jgi:hypothetical protein